MPQTHRLVLCVWLYVCMNVCVCVYVCMYVCVYVCALHNTVVWAALTLVVRHTLDIGIQVLLLPHNPLLSTAPHCLDLLTLSWPGYISTKWYSIHLSFRVLQSTTTLRSRKLCYSIYWTALVLLTIIYFYISTLFCSTVHQLLCSPYVSALNFPFVSTLMPNGDTHQWPSGEL